MINNNFDKDIANILRDLKVSYDGVSWKRLEKKLKEDEGEDTVFDSIIADKLKAFSVPMAGGSYERLEAKIGYSNKKNTFYWKLSSVAAAILFLAFGFMYINRDNLSPKTDLTNVLKHNYNPNISKAKKVNVTDGVVITNRLDGNSKFEILKSNDENQIKIVQSGMNRVCTSTKSNFSSDDKGVYIGDDIMSNMPGTSNYGLSMVGWRNKSPYGFGIQNKINFLNDYTSFNLNISIRFEGGRGDYNNKKLDYEFFDMNNSSFKAKISNNSREGQSIVLANIDNETESEELNLVSKGNMVSDVNSEITDQDIVNNTSSDGLFIKGGFIPSVNIIKTPNDRILKIPGYTQIDDGFGAGIALSYKKGKHEIESGIDVVKLNYSPRKTIAKDNSSSFYLDKIKHLKIRIPLVYKYHMIENENWDVYAIAGVSANTLKDSNYKFIEQKIDNDGNVHTLSIFAKELQNNLNFQNTLYAQKDYSNGVVDGGKINDNLFVEAKVGLGISKRMRHGLSFYIEPQLNYSFNGIGPNTDLINSIDFKLGVSKAINL